MRSSRSEDLPSTSARETGVRASVGMSRCAKLAGAAGGTGAPPAPAAAAASSFPSPRAALLASPQNITQAQEPKQANGAGAHGESSRGRLLEVAAADDDDLHGAHPLPAHREAPSRSSRSRIWAAHFSWAWRRSTAATRVAHWSSEAPPIHSSIALGESMAAKRSGVSGVWLAGREPESRSSSLVHWLAAYSFCSGSGVGAIVYVVKPGPRDHVFAGFRG